MKTERMAARTHGGGERQCRLPSLYVTSILDSTLHRNSGEKKAFKGNCGMDCAVPIKNKEKETRHRKHRP